MQNENPCECDSKPCPHDFSVIKLEAWVVFDQKIEPDGPLSQNAVAIIEDVLHRDLKLGRGAILVSFRLTLNSEESRSIATNAYYGEFSGPNNGHA